MFNEINVIVSIFICLLLSFSFSLGLVWQMHVWLTSPLLIKSSTQWPSLGFHHKEWRLVSLYYLLLTHCYKNVDYNRFKKMCLGIDSGFIIKGTNTIFKTFLQGYGTVLWKNNHTQIIIQSRVFMWPQQVWLWNLINLL